MVDVVTPDHPTHSTSPTPPTHSPNSDFGGFSGPESRQSPSSADGGTDVAGAADGGAGVVCAACGESAGNGARFCEACGAPLQDPAPTTSPDPSPPHPASSAPHPASSAPHTTAPNSDFGGESTLGSRRSPSSAGGEGAGHAGVCAACGGQVAEDGYCLECGARAPVGRDHVTERAAPHVAGVSDVGVRRRRNEDAMALGVVGDAAVLVVCDGVSSAPDSDAASLAAAVAARDVLVAGLTALAAATGPDSTTGSDATARVDSTTGSGTTTGSSPATGSGTTSSASDAATGAPASRHVPGTVPADAGAWSQLLVAAGRAADTAVRDAVDDAAGREDPPSSTFAAAVVRPSLVVAGWLGDSRAYWLPDDGRPEQLTQDDSVAAELVAEGMSRAQAEASPQAHAITRWLGADAPDTTARTIATRPAGPGWLLVCSDGLWNYASAPEAVAGVLRDATASVGSDPAALASALVAWANASGGHDNTTVALARVGARATAPVGVHAPDDDAGTVPTVRRPAPGNLAEEPPVAQEPPAPPRPPTA